MVRQLSALAYILAIYHALALFVDFRAAKTLLGSGYLSIMFALLERDLMSGMVRVCLSRIVKHVAWCAALVIFLTVFLK